MPLRCDSRFGGALIQALSNRQFTELAQLEKGKKFTKKVDLPLWVYSQRSPGGAAGTSYLKRKVEQAFLNF